MVATPDEEIKHVLCDSTERTLGNLFLVFPGIRPTRTFPLLILLCVLSL